MMQGKLIQIGNSKGLRIPKRLIEKYHFKNELEIIEKDSGILIKAKDEKNSKLSWEDTYKEMMQENEEWNDFEITTMDGNGWN